MKDLILRGREIMGEYRRLDCPSLAASLSFNALLCLLPILMIVVSVFGYFLGQSETLIQELGRLVGDVVPTLREDFMGNLQTITGRDATFGWVGILFLLVVAHFFFANLEHTVNRLLGTTDRRHFLLTHLFLIVWLLGIVLILSVPSLIHFVFSVMERWGHPPRIDLILTGHTWFFVSAWASFVMLMMIVPRKKVTLSNALVVGFFFAVLLQAARLLFRLYTLYQFDRYNLIYGSLTAIILGALWIYYFFNILLLCVLWVGKRQPLRTSPLH